ncbi:hypothetical protein [Arthrobacter sp. NEB 688]|uniref:hypothetical protein n=1 Tax=Arthrobacter sp. NEB 688 TaxID=904039 RepID=UPI001562F199|nr:hypothetical protein [Arthrobacter sp. NEB 688]QKE84357.1 hypothetical protein HL663_10715 [Arthrobacter sp. NEB 688]
MGTTRRQLVAMVTGWLLVVLVVGGVTFAVVSRAGDEVGQASALRTMATSAPEPSGTGSGRPTRTAGSASPSPDGSEDPEPPDPSASPEGPTSSPTRTSGPTRTTRPPSTPSAQTRTASFTTIGGTVVASCTGSSIRRESITARDGWRFEDEVERGRLEVHFARAGGEGSEGEPGESESDDDDEVELSVVCVDGAPTRRSH